MKFSRHNPRLERPPRHLDPTLTAEPAAPTRLLDPPGRPRRPAVTWSSLLGGLAITAAGAVTLISQHHNTVIPQADRPPIIRTTRRVHTHHSSTTRAPHNTTTTPPPNRLNIPALGVNAPLDAVAAIGGPTGAVLNPPADIAHVGWWDGQIAYGNPANPKQLINFPTPKPGQPGIAVIAGHINWAGIGPGALANLAQLKPGDTFTVTLSGTVTTWDVITNVTISKTALPSVLGTPGGPPRVALVTCGGPYNPDTGHYYDNTIVTAVQDSTQT